MNKRPRSTGTPSRLQEEVNARRVSISERRTLVASLVEAGKLLSEIINLTGETDAAIRRDLRALGIDISAVSSRNDRLEKNRSAIIQLSSSGMPIKEIATELGLSERQVKLISQKHQIEIARPVFKYDKHGNAQAYNKGCRCDPCKDFNTARRREYRKNILNSPIPEELHGTPSGYANWGCRCDRCKEAGSAYNKAHRYHDPSKKRTRTTWTDEEDQMVLTYSLTSKQLAEKLGKTSTAVAQRRNTLRKAGFEMRD